MTPPLSRRQFVSRAIAASALACAPLQRLAAQVRFSADPFQLGVASGDPAADGFVIWTRLVPDPSDPRQLGNVMYEVTWEVASRADFAEVLASGVALARPHLAHAVHVEVGGLQPGREYWYRFRLGRYESAAGRALTLPAADALPASLSFAVSSCAHYEQGFFSAYRYMAADRPDLMLTLGDYIYEVGYGDGRVRAFDKREAVTLDDYRRRYTEYRLDPDLRAAHQACPWLVSWDDHEVDNDYAGLNSEDELCGGERVRSTFPARRAAAYQAWFEHMPVRPSRMLPGNDVRLYGSLDWGRLARFHLLDTRQYRSPQACANVPSVLRCDLEAGRKLRPGGAGGGRQADPRTPACAAELEDPARTMLGAEQERWLDGSFEASTARWNVLAQSVFFAGLLEGTRESPRVFTDAWVGYPAARRRVLESLARHKVANPVVLTGDIHAFFLAEVEDSRRRPVAVELVTSSIANRNSDKSAALPLNPHVKYHDGTHSGYIRCELTPQRLRVDYVGIADIRDPASGRETLASFEVRSGNPRATRV